MLTNPPKPAPSFKRRAAGAASKRAGEAWEKYVASSWLEPLRKLGVLRCWHKLEPRKVGDRFVADAGADFVACMHSGEYVAIECKQTTGRRFCTLVNQCRSGRAPRRRTALVSGAADRWAAVPNSVAQDAVGDDADERKRHGGRLRDLGSARKRAERD